MDKILKIIEESALIAKLAVIEKDSGALIDETEKMMALGVVLSDIFDSFHEDDEENNNEPPKKVNHGNTRLPVCFILYSSFCVQGNL